MSWDIFVQDFPRDAQTVSNIPSDFQPGIIAKRSSVIAAIRSAFTPFAAFKSPSHGAITRPGLSIDVSLGDHEDVSGFVFRVHEIDKEGIRIIHAILKRLGLRGVASGDFFAPETAWTAYEKWRAYRGNVTS